MTIPLPDLPIVACLDELRDSLATGHVVLDAAPGSGKTTLVPLALLDQPWLQQRKVLMLEPRRPAARMAAQRMASLLGEHVGETVGYQVRLDRKISRRTRIEVLTEGLLVRRLQQDPTLEGVGLVIFDEFHERNLQADLGLALALDVCRELRDDLRLLVMSATLDHEPVCRMLPAVHVQAEGRQYPVEVRFLPPQDRREPLQAIPGLVRRALKESHGDLLLFLPGRREIEQTARLVEDDCLAHGARIERLYGDLAGQAQDRVLRPRAGGRRVILSTDLAESSLTIEGVTSVVDSGLARKPAFDPNTGMTRLQLQPVSRASADQRAGRAGRLGPGLCLRAWTEARHARLLADRPPEISEADLSSLVLELALWGVDRPDSLSWLDQPPAAHWQQARQLLQWLDALDRDGGLTRVGREMAQLGLEPRLARLLLAAQNAPERKLACELAALLSERDLLGPGQGADLELRLQALRRERGGADRHRVQAVRRLADSLQRRLPTPGDGGECRDPACLLAQVFPDRVALRRGGHGRFLLANGRGVMLDEGDGLAAAEWLVVAQLDAGSREGRIWSALAIEREQLQGALAGHIEQAEELRWEEKREAVEARTVERLGSLVLAQRTAEPADAAAAQALLLQQVHKRWPHGLDWGDAALQLRARVQRIAVLDAKASWPDFGDQALLGSLEHWLGPCLQGKLRWTDVQQLDLAQCLLGLLDWQARQRLDDWLPVQFVTPAGSRRSIDYACDGDPQLALPLQEIFGQAQTPVLADGRQPMVLSLLNPAGRPLALTADLASFWRTTYPQVRKELRGRYPRHNWPEDPLQAVARRGTGRRK